MIVHNKKHIAVPHNHVLRFRQRTAYHRHGGARTDHPFAKHHREFSLLSVYSKQRVKHTP